ncbi:TPA: hypothetical protein ACG4MZ_000097 [Klebsiella aerogenes]
MTNNKLTKEWLQQTIAELESVRDEIPFGIDTNSELELAAFKMALAAMDSEPFGFTDGDRRGMIYKPEHADRLNEPLPLYRHAQPAPVVSFYRDGIEAAAKWLDQQREAYDSEHGWTDPDTGAFEFGNDAQRDYSSTLEELAEGIRALHQNAGNSPVIPDCWCRTCRPVALNDMRFVVCPDCGNKRCPRANDHRNSCTWSNDPDQEGSAYPAAPQEVKGD